MSSPRAFQPEDWDVSASKAASTGLSNANLLQALVSVFLSKPLQGGSADFCMGVQAAPGLWRSARSPTALVGNLGEFANMAELFDHACAQYADEPCMGSRPILRMRVEDKVEKYVLGPYAFINYKQAHDVASAFGRGLTTLGVSAGQMVNFFADTCQEYQLAVQGCFQQGIVVSTTYANLGEDAVAYAIQQAEVPVVFTDAHLAASVVARVLSQCPKVKHVVFIPDRRTCTHSTYVADESVQAKLPKGIKAHSYAQIVAAGQALSDKPRPKITAERICVLMYTSGSTAKPKGVLISHANMLAVVAGTTLAIPDMGPGDRFLGYLPLAHILEMIAEIGSLTCGSCIGYGSPRTLSDVGVCIDPGTCRGDAPEFKPTLLAAVPMIFDKIRSNVLLKVEQTGGIAAKLFHYALNSKTTALERGLAFALWDLLVFDKLRARLLGGKVRYMLSGGGPLSRATQLFMNVVFNCPVGQGFGLTETVGACCTVWPNDRSYGRVGAPIVCSQIRLEDWAEGGYFTTDTPNPRGEVVVGGPNVTMGYFKLPDESAKAYFVDEQGMRWFRTGDVGEIFPNGTLQIIDRKKDLVKLSGGEYVSYGKLEPLVRDSELVDNCFMYADSESSYCVVVVTPRPHLKEIPAVEAVLADVHRIMQKAGCLSFEMPKKCHVAVDCEWTPQSDLVTAALKLKRANLQKHYADVLKKLYR